LGILNSIFSIEQRFYAFEEKSWNYYSIFVIIGLFEREGYLIGLDRVL
jgi:hypothetical protein